MDAGRVAAALRAVIGLRVPPETLGYLAEVLSELSAEELSDPLEVRTLLEPFLLDSDALKPGRERPTDTKSLVLVEALCEEVHGRLMAGLSAAGPPARCGEGPADQRMRGSRSRRRRRPRSRAAGTRRGRPCAAPRSRWAPRPCRRVPRWSAWWPPWRCSTTRRLPTSMAFLPWSDRQ
ncbi:unnamed protein product [Prorocentrum cordatum]|uniref:Uncharacterized protein n=1 Tax=Prorocentrum cordatum TaxID=2364126 RepID=A0ABN9XPL5_9DINO|nr:unnamed protein product [Polarella glacialis]